jgi:hypothetical protein
LADGHE